MCTQDTTCQAVAPSLRLVAAARSGHFPGLADLDLDAPTINDALSDNADLLWAVRTFLPASITPDGVEHHRVYTRDECLAAYPHLTLQDLVAASRWCRTTDEHHEVSRVLTQRFGVRPVGMRNERRPAERQVLWLAYEEVLVHRRRLVASERTDEDRAKTAAAVAEEKAGQDRTYRSRNHQAAVARAQQRFERDEYLTPHERELLGITR